MDKRAVEQGDIHFFELAALSVDTKTDKREVTLKLSDFVIPPDDLPEDVRRTVKHWSQWIDYWAVDWDNKGDTFHNEWQTYRSRNEPKLDLETRRSPLDEAINTGQANHGAQRGGETMNPVHLRQSLPQSSRANLPVRRCKSVQFNVAIRRKRIESTSGLLPFHRRISEAHAVRAVNAVFGQSGPTSRLGHHSRVSVRFHRTANIGK
jgi:hypothetical protein